jgi:hypothetical protein
MDAVIDEAVKASKSKRKADTEVDEERPIKKKKVSKDKGKKVVEAIPITKDEIDKLAMSKKELKNLYLKYPDLDISRAVEIDELVESLSAFEVKKMLENMNSELKMKVPNSTSEDALGMIALILQRMTGNPRIYKKLMEDEKLHAAFEQICPRIEDYISVPLLIFHRLGTHFSEVLFTEEK